ncbi:acyl-CoA dehydrogenase family protein [Nocardioides carbamazepini]|uniref:acyl-CoA dehydrogenase family protein n=1 Tax=Nocardioides carbamazepini TaxID=2854259 RepID=UPI00214A5944|nr:acyl-CoA dehydrogenase family protein [Nocardioides carbamazepini]MCR1785064.1 acyl-CoA dehydrogenase family protein [Nocardioides carbamazepini]
MIPYGHMEERAGLRSRLRGLMAEHLPEHFHGAFTDDPDDFAVSQQFCKTLGSEGLLAISWPREDGGSDADEWDLTILREEMWAHDEPRGAQYMGVNWVGPAIKRFGSEEQQRYHLPRIASGESVWCQGFSEPESGSDLASLRTRAVPNEDGWVVDGQKVWTSYASMAGWMFLLARTDPQASRGRGLTVFLVPLDRPGVEVRPIRSMLGPHHLNEVFIDGLQVYPSDVLGEVDGGWALINEALAFERVGIARYARCERLLRMAPDELGPERWSALPAALRHRWLRALVHCRRARLLAYRVISRQREHRGDPAGAAAYRIAVTLLDQEAAEVLMEILDAAGLVVTSPGDDFVRSVENHVRYAQASTIASGTLEIQRVLLARTILGDSNA